MAKDKKQNKKVMPDDVAQNPGARKVALDENPSISKIEAENAVEGKSPNAAGGGVPSTAEDHVPSNASPETSNLPTANSPLPPEDIPSQGN